MKYYRSLLLGVIALSFMTVSSYAQFFTFTQTSQSLSFSIQSNVTPTIGGVAMEAGDEIGLFTERGGQLSACFGAGVYQGAGNSLTINGWQEELFPLTVDGFKSGENVIVRVYDQSAGVVYENDKVQINWTLSNDSPYNGTFNTGFVLILIKSLNVLAPPAPPSTFNPADGAVGIPRNGTMTWEDISAFADTYDLQISSDGINADLADETGLATNSYNYTNLNYGATILWRVRGVNTEGAGVWSAWQQVQVELETPTLLSPADMSSGFAIDGGTISWNAVNGASDYFFEIYSDAALTVLEYSLNTANTSATSDVNWGLANGVQYWWRVRAENGANTSPFTAAWSFTTQIGAPVLNSPADMAVLIGTPQPIMHDWDDLNGAVSYEVQADEDMNFGSPLMGTPAMSEFSLGGLPSWTTIYWRVRGIDADNNPGSWSAVWSYQTDLTGATNPMPMDGATGQELAGNLSWDAVNGATEYTVYLSTNMADPKADQVAGFPITTANTTVAYAGLNFEQNYYWVVEVKNAQSAVTGMTWTFQARLDTPTLTSPADMSNCQETTVLLDWADFGIIPGNGDYYNVQLSTDMNFGSFVVGYDGTAQYTTDQLLVPGLMNSQTYYWRVQAFKGGQLTGYSPAWSFTTENDIVMLSSPMNYANGVPVTNVMATWQAVPTATTYTFEIDTDPAFPAPTQVMTANTNVTVAGPILNNQVYYWRVYSDACGADMPAEATVYQFLSQLDEPTLISPLDGAIDQSLSGTLSWNAVPGANYYNVQISTTPDFSANVHTDENVAGTTYNYVGIQNATTHYWRVRGYNNAYGAPTQGGEPGEWSAVRSFTTIPLGPPQRTLPADGTVGAFSGSDENGFFVDVFWNQFPDAISYDVQASTDPTFADAGQLVFDETTLTQTARISGLSFGQTIYWRARTRTLDGVSNWHAVPFSFTVIVEPVISGLNDICEGLNSIYTVANDQSVGYIIDYQWEVTGGTILGDDDNTSVDVDFPASGAAQIKVTRSSAFWGDYTDEFTLDVTVNPTVELNTTYEYTTTYPNKVCVFEDIVFTAVEDLEVTNYEWVWVDGESRNVISNLASFTYEFPMAGIYTIELNASNPAICGKSTYQMDIEVFDDCPVVVDVEDGAECLGKPYTFVTDVWGGDGNYSYFWHDDSDMINQNTSTPTIPNVRRSETFSLQVIDGNALSGIDFGTLTLTQGPTITTERRKNVGFNEAVVDLTTEVKSRTGNAPFSDEWYYEEGGQKTVVDPLAAPTKFGIRIYRVTTTDASGCESRPSVIFVIRSRSKEIPSEMFEMSINKTAIMAAYPNPIVDNVNVIAEFDAEVNATVKLVDILGNEFTIDQFSGSFYENTLNITEFTSGTYFIVIETENDKVIQKIVKQ